MNFFIILLELWALALVCVLVGRRIVCLLPRVVGRNVGFYLAPILGLATLLLIATLYGWIIPYNYKLSIGITLLLVFLAVIFDKKKSSLMKDSAWICAFAFVSALPILAPIIRFDGFNPFTDIFTYLMQAQWLQEHAFTEKVITSGNYPGLTQIALYQETGSRMGGSFFLGFVQSLFALKWSYNAYIATVSLALFCGSLALGAVIRRTVPLRRVIILALSLIPSLTMNGFIYGAEWGFYPQTLGLAFALGICALFPFVMEIVLVKNSGLVKIIRYSLPIAICAAALLFAYNEPFPIFLAGMGLYLLVVAFNNYKKLKLLVVYVCTFSIEVLLLVNYEAIRIFNNIYQTLTISHGMADIGWPVLWSPIQFFAFAFGMKSPFHNKPFSFDYFYSTFFALIIISTLIITLISFMTRHVKRRQNIIFLTCIELVLLIFFIKFRYFSVDKSVIEVGHTFLQFKIAKYATPFALSLLGIFMAILWHSCKKRRELFKYAYLVLFVVGLLWFHCRISAKNYTNHFLNEVQQRRHPFNVLLDLRKSLSAIPKDKIVYVELGYEHSKLRQMVAYILYDRKIASDYRDDGYILGRLPDEERNMSKDGAYKIITLQKDNSQEGEVVGPFLIK